MFPAFMNIKIIVDSLHKFSLSPSISGMICKVLPPTATSPFLTWLAVATSIRLTTPKMDITLIMRTKDPSVQFTRIMRKVRY